MPPRRGGAACGVGDPSHKNAESASRALLHFGERLQGGRVGVLEAGSEMR